MTALERILLARADEQTSSVSLRGKESDPWRLVGGDRRVIEIRRVKFCRVQRCGRKAKSGGYCTTHYYRLKQGLELEAAIRPTGREVQP